MQTRLIKLLHPMRRAYWHIVKPKTFGVKVAIFNADRSEVLLVRHRYGSPSLMLPGGAIERGEEPHDAAAREILEEIGLQIAQSELKHIYCSSSEGKQDTIYLFSAVASGKPNIDHAELSDAAFFALSPPPSDASPATLRRLRELSSGEFPDSW